MLNFKSISHKLGGLAKSARFAARIIPSSSFLSYLTTGESILQDLTYLCESTEFPGRSFNNMDVRHYGPNHKVPYQSVYEDINMTFLCRAESMERKLFDDWMSYINPPNNFDFNYRDEYTCQIEIFQFTDETLDGYNPDPRYAFTLLNAYPILVNPQPVTWADEQFLRLGITFSYTWWTRKFSDPQSNGFGGNGYDLVSGAVNTY